MFQTLQQDGFKFTSTATQFNITRAGFGDGFDDAKTLDDGQRKWTVKIEALPDLRPPAAPLVETKTRALYLWDFFIARKIAGDEPFWILDPKTALLYLASFTDEALSFEILCAKVYSAGLELRERRVNGTVSPTPEP